MGNNIDAISYDSSSAEHSLMVTSVNDTVPIDEYKCDSDWILDIESWSVGDEFVSVKFENKKNTLHGIEHPATIHIDKEKLKEFIQDVLN